MSTTPATSHPGYVSIAPLLKDLAANTPGNAKTVSPSDISLAFARTFEDRLNGTQLSALLTLLHSTGFDRHPDVIAKCASAMRDAATQTNPQHLRTVLGKRKRTLGTYSGGLCDIVGTGGDSHSTFNISTCSSIVASPLLLTAKHGNRAQTSMSGSADVLAAIRPTPPNISAVTAEHLPELYEECNYAFLFAPNFHPGMKYAATVRRELGLRTIFNLMGPLANPVEEFIEARVVGVAYQALGPVFAKALQLSGATKAMVVCGAEDLDEISCAGPTNCWFLKGGKRKLPKQEVVERAVINGSEAGEVEAEAQAGAGTGGTGTDLSRQPSASNGTDEDEDSSSETEEAVVVAEVEQFALTPEDFGLPRHPLSEVGGGKLPKQNALTLMSLLKNELEHDHPILHFVLMNVAGLLVVSGVCDADECESGPVITERGPGGQRWKEGVKKARWCIESGRAVQELEKFIKFSNSL